MRGYHPLLAVAAGTGDVLMARLREGRANTGRGAGRFLRETIGRVRHAGATGQLTMRADSGFYAHAVVAMCRKLKVRYSHHRAAAPEPAGAHRGHPRGRPGRPSRTGSTVAPTSPRPMYTPFKGEKDAVPVRLIVRRVRPTPGSQLSVLHDSTTSTPSSPTGRGHLELEADHRRHAEVENA